MARLPFLVHVGKGLCVLTAQLFQVSAACLPGACVKALVCTRLLLFSLSQKSLIHLCSMPILPTNLVESDDRDAD